MRKLAVTPYASGLLSLQANEEQLIMGLKKKWRYSLRKAQGANVNISMQDGNSKNLKVLLSRYSDLKKKNEFNGIADSLIFVFS